MCESVLSNEETNSWILPPNQGPVLPTWVAMSWILATPLQFEIFVFEAINCCVPTQIGRQWQGSRNGCRRQKEDNSVWVCLVFKLVCEFLRPIFVERKFDNIWRKYQTNDLFLVAVNFFSWSKLERGKAKREGDGQNTDPQSKDYRYPNGLHNWTTPKMDNT